jgi:putative transposase
MIAAVVLPDHLHCVWQLPPDDADNAARWKSIKAAFSRSLPRANGDHSGACRGASAVSVNGAIGNT